MTIGEHHYTERKAAGAQVLRLIAEAGWEGKKNTVIAQIGGFDLSIGVSRDLRMRAVEAALFLHRDGRQRIELPDEPSALGLIARLESALERFEIEQAEQQDRLAGAERRLADFQPRIGSHFEFEAELAAKRAEHERLEAELAAPNATEAAKDERDAVGAFEEAFGVVIQFPGRGRLPEGPDEEDDGQAEAG